MNWFDLAVLIIVGLTFIWGFVSGLVMQLASLVGLVLAAIFAGQLSDLIAPRLIAYTEVSPHIGGPVSYIVAFVAILIAIVLIGKAIQKAIDALELNTLNRLGGAVFSVAKWFVLISIVLNLIVEIDQDKRLIKEDVRQESLAYPYVKGLATMVVPYLRFDWAESL